jgi:hypothetical protein
MINLREDAINPPGGHSPNPGHPPGWKQTALTDIMTPPQMQHLMSLLDANPDPEDALTAMKKYFNSIRADLEAKEVDAGYLAYVLYSKITGII